MSRIDARVQVQLIGKASYPNNAGNHSQQVLIKDLSLGGALVRGLVDCSDYVRIKSELLNGETVELEGAIVRLEQDIAGLELYYSDMRTLEILWNSIRKKVTGQRCCPYCGTIKASGIKHCITCLKPFNFEDEDYLKNHIRDTFLDRIKGRIGKLNFSQLEKIINIMDREILKGLYNALDGELQSAAGDGKNSLGVMKHEVAKTQKLLVEKVLKENNYIISRSSKALGISRPSLYDLMKKLHISKPNGAGARR